MLKNIKTKSLSKSIENVSDIILEEKPQSRLIFKPFIHSEGVRGRIIRERRNSRDDPWISDEHLRITSIKKGHNLNFELSTEVITKLYDAIKQCCSILEKHGIEDGINDYTVLKIDDSNVADIIKKLLEQGYSKEIWTEIGSTEPDLAIKLSNSRLQEERKQSLQQFKKILDKDNMIVYKERINKKTSQDEKIWQEYFEGNNWIFGYGLDYKFMRILQREFHASNSEADGSEVVISDYLMGDRRFTTFVELKLPQTPLFRQSRIRSGCWKLSSELLEAVSQILEQKATGEIKIETKKKLHDEKGNEILNRPYNSKVILIVGNWDQISEDSSSVREIKKKTFELFRRELRNLEIITYDELLERASYILQN